MTPSRPNSLPTLGPRSLLASLCLFWFSDTVADPDLWGHVRYGQDILRTGSIIQVDTYSYRTAGRPWINHEWLSEAFFAAIYNRSGPSGLIVLKVVVSLLILGLCNNHLRKCGLGLFRSACLLVLISVPFRLGLGTIRPQIFTYLLFLIELLLLERTPDKHEARLWILPIPLTAWVNLHGGVLAGIGLLGLWILVRMLVRARDRNGPLRRRLVALVSLLLLGLLCALTMLLNPYGAQLPEFLLRTAIGPRPEIREWTPLDVKSLPGLLNLALVTIGVIGLLGSRRRRSPESLLILSVTAILPLISNRHYPLFALALVVFGGEHIADTWNRWQPTALATSHWSRALAAISLIVAPLLIVLSLPAFGCIRIEPYYFAFPARAVALLKQSRIHGNMAVPFDWGEYVIWHLGPAVKVSIDGRRETVYSEERYRQSLAFEQGTMAWDHLLSSGPATDLVLLPNGSPTVAALSRKAAWIPLYRDSLCVVFARDGFPDLDRIVRTPVPSLPDDGNRLCFPAPGDGASSFGGKGTGRDPPDHRTVESVVPTGPADSRARRSRPSRIWAKTSSGLRSTPSEYAFNASETRFSSS